MISLSDICASGNGDVSEMYVDLGKFKVAILGRGEFFTISLPYIKPEGINTVPALDIPYLILNQLVIDEREVKGKRLFSSSKMFIDRIYLEDVDEKESIYYMNMEWFVEGTENKKRILRLVYTSETGNTQKREQYIIPYGAKEAFLTYSIRIPIYEQGQGVIDSFYTEPQTVKWTMEWSEETTN
jgi:hypothetical protein